MKKFVESDLDDDFFTSPFPLYFVAHFARMALEKIREWKPFRTSDPIVQKINDDCYSDVFEGRDPEELNYIELKECLETSIELRRQEIHPCFSGTGSTHKASVYETIETLLRKRLREFRRVDHRKTEALKAAECNCCVYLREGGLVVLCPGVTIDNQKNTVSIGGPCHSGALTRGGRMSIMTCSSANRNQGENPCALCIDCYVAYKPHLFPLDRRFQ